MQNGCRLIFLLSAVELVDTVFACIVTDWVGLQQG